MVRTAPGGSVDAMTEHTPLISRGRVAIGPVKSVSTGPINMPTPTAGIESGDEPLYSTPPDDISIMVSSSAPASTFAMGIVPPPTAPSPVFSSIGANVEEVMPTLERKDQQLLARLIEMVRERGVPVEQATYWDAAMISRFLSARDFDVQKAMKMIEETIRWRSEYRPDLIRPSDVATEARPGKVYVHGHDRLGRPVVYMRMARDTDSSAEDKLRFVVYTLERAALSMRRGVDKMVWLIDLDGMSTRMVSSSNLQMSGSVLKLLQNHYPERLGVAVFINQPWIFSAFWAVMKKILHEKTCRKVIFLQSAVAKQRVQLADVFDMEDPLQLESVYGGANPHVFSLPDWLQRETAFFARLRRERSSNIPTDMLAAAAADTPTDGVGPAVYGYSSQPRPITNTRSGSGPDGGGGTVDTLRLAVSHDV